MADYYEGHPDPEDASTWGDAESFEDAQAAFEAANGPAPTPPQIPGPPSPGVGMPAARVGDLCAHGGAITGPGFATVQIGFMPAVRAMPAMDQAACPMFNGPVPHATGTILKGSNTVLIGFMPAARVSDPIGPPTVCAGNQIAMGCNKVLIGDKGGRSPGGGGGGGGGGSGGGGSGGGGGGGDSAVETDPPPEQTYADTEPATAPPGESKKNVGTGTHWIEIEMVDEAEQPVVGEAYRVTLPDGKKVEGGLDEKGQVRIDGIKQPGWCRISFPNLDLAAWQRWRPMSPATASAPVTPPPAAAAARAPDVRRQTSDVRRETLDVRRSDAPISRPASHVSGGPVPQGLARGCGEWRRVLQGECISSIAKDTGHFWQTIWDHMANAELKLRRRDPNVLLPGDAVLVPNKRPKEDPGSTDQHHKFRRRGEPSRLRLRVYMPAETVRLCAAEDEPDEEPWAADPDVQPEQDMRPDQGAQPDDDSGAEPRPMDEGGQPAAQRPWASVPYRLMIDAQTWEGTTDADGQIDQPIPGNARRGTLIVSPGTPDEVIYPLQLGHLCPVNSLRGVKGRLLNLGFACGPDNEEENAAFAQALQRFQEQFGLEVTGRLDEATRQRIEELHRR